jgi:5-methylcytosine-specific restriction endonuclease McrA
MSEFLTLKNKISKRIKNITGIRYGRLIALEIAGKTYRGRRLWKCLCDCGTEKIIKAGDLTRGHVKSCGCLSRVPAGHTSKIGLFNSYKKASLRRNLNFYLTFERFLELTSSNCFYCGNVPSNTYKVRSHKYTYNGIDRVFNDIGYTEDNSVTCCEICNKAKRDLEPKQFLDWIKRISTRCEAIENKLNIKMYKFNNK